jgi:hypothetical protein
MTTDTLTLPPLQQTLPGRSREYRLFNREFVDYDDLAGLHSRVTTDGWGVSYTSVYGEGDRVTLHIYDTAKLHAGGDYKHPLYGTTYDTLEDASRAAFDVGALAFMVYEDRR